MGPRLHLIAVFPDNNKEQVTGNRFRILIHKKIINYALWLFLIRLIKKLIFTFLSALLFLKINRNTAKSQIDRVSPKRRRKPNRIQDFAIIKTAQNSG